VEKYYFLQRNLLLSYRKVCLFYNYLVFQPLNIIFNIYLQYLDANNLYGWAMSKCLPSRGFKWVNTEVDVTHINMNLPKGYIF
jgi:hypothetical protein